MATEETILLETIDTRTLQHVTPWNYNRRTDCERSVIDYYVAETILLGQNSRHLLLQRFETFR